LTKDSATAMIISTTITHRTGTTNLINFN